MKFASWSSLKAKKTSSGFTLTEALLSIVVLGYATAVMTGLYHSGLQALDAQGERQLLDSQLRSRMELLLSDKFDQLADGSETVTVNGVDYTISWAVANVDLDGDDVPEATAKQINMALGDHTLTTIVVDHEGKIGKL